MWNIIKSLFRYSFKNKVSLITLTFLTFLATGIFSSLLMLSDNLSNSYNKLVTEGNLNNAVVHELYSTSVDGQPDLTGEAAKTENKRLFLESLDQMIGKANYRRFNSIDFNATSSGFAYKVVENDPNYTIDKIVNYGGNNLLPMTYDYTTIINEATWSNNSLKSADARRLIIYLASKADWTDTSFTTKFNNAYEILESIPRPSDDEAVGEYDPKNNTNLGKEEDSGTIKNIIMNWLDSSTNKYTPLVNKYYRLAFEIRTDAVPVVGRIDNFSSYATVVPTYVLENHNKQIVSDEIYQKFLEYNNPNTYNNQSAFANWFAALPAENKIRIDNIDFLIVGAGITPSFMYPVFSFAKTIPNTKSEIIAFSNMGGFQMTYDSNRTSPVDDYLVLKLPDPTQNVINQINALSKKYMSWPANIPSAYFANDTNNSLSPIGIRISFLPTLIDMQVGLSNGLALFIMVLTSIVFLFSVNKFIDDNKPSLATLRANGIKKRSIIWSTSIFGLLPSTIGGGLGYLFAQFTQLLLLSLYSGYWVVPTATVIFNVGMLIGLIVVPFALMACISVVASYLVLRKNASKLLSDSSNKFKVTPATKLAAGVFAKANIITKFRVSVAFSSMPKLIAITTLFTLVATAVTFSTSLSNKFNEVKTATFDVKKYNFSIDLVTPTVQGGQFFGTSFKNIGKPIINKFGEVINFNVGMVDNGNIIASSGAYNTLRGQNWNDLKYYDTNGQINPNFEKQFVPVGPDSTITSVGNYALNHLPSFNDSGWQTSDLSYLNNRMQTQLNVDLKIGIGDIATNPWDIVRNLAPINVIVNADKMTKELWTRIINDEGVYFTDANIKQYGSPSGIVGLPFNEIFVNNNYLVYQGVEKPDIDDSLLTYKDSNQANAPAGWYLINKNKFSMLGAVNSAFIILSNKILTLDHYQDAIFKSLYNWIAINDDDETYTNVSATITVPFSTKNSDNEVTIKGIKPDTKFLELVNKNNEIVNAKLLLAGDVEKDWKNEIHSIYHDPIVLEDSQNYNMIINESSAFKYGLKIGDYVSVDPFDEATRKDPSKTIAESKLNFDEYNNRLYKFKVIDIVKTYQYPEFFVNQRIANHINVMDYETILNTAYKNDYIYDEEVGKDIGVIVTEIDPYNGYFTNSTNPESLSLMNTTYSESSLAPATDKFSKSNLIMKILEKTLGSTAADLNAQLDQGTYMSKMQLAWDFGFVNPDGSIDMTGFESKYPPLNADATSIDRLYNDLISIYGINPLTSTIYSVEQVEMFAQIFDNLAVFTESIMTLVMVILFSISILSVIFLSVEFISSAISIIAILKALGFADHSNVFAFLSMFFPAIIIAVGLSIPLSTVLMFTVQTFIYGFGSVLLPLAYQWWYFIVPTLLLFSILGATIIIAIILLRKQDITRAIARY